MEKSVDIMIATILLLSAVAFAVSVPFERLATLPTGYAVAVPQQEYVNTADDSACERIMPADPRDCSVGLNERTGKDRNCRQDTLGNRKCEAYYRGGNLRCTCLGYLN